MKDKKKITIIILIILVIGLVISLISASTYALFSSEAYGSNPNNFSTGLLSIEAVSKSDNISLTNAIPLTDAEGIQSTPYVFSIKNTGNLDYQFNVKLLSTGSNTFSSEYIKLQIDDGEIITLSSLTNSIIKSNVTLLAGESIDVSIRAWLSIDTPNSELGKNFESKIVIDGQAVYTESNNIVDTLGNYISNLYEESAKTPVVNNSITYQYDTTHNLMSDVGGNIRYYGASPNNYIYFNCDDYSNQSETTCEKWRIIGVFDDKVKIIRDKTIGGFSWDYDYNDDLSSTTYDNDWSTATLQKLLNNQYYNSIDTTYYNSGSTEAVNFNTNKTGLKNNTTRNMIADVTWNLGGWDNNSVYPDQIYKYERGTRVYNGRPTSWTGKVALMYFSDYGYATDFTKCSNVVYAYDSSTDSYACRTNDWLFNSVYQWTLTPNSGFEGRGWPISNTGGVDNTYGTYNKYSVRPTLYLDPNINISEGDGSSSLPYSLSVS